MEYLAVSILDILCVIMPRWAEPRRHTVVGLCVCVVCMCVCVYQSKELWQNGKELDAENCNIAVTQ